MFSKLTKGDLLMVSASCAWGFSYIFMKMGLGTLMPLQFVFLRFAIAFPFLLLVFRRKVWPTKTELKYSAVLGVALVLLALCFTCGMITTDASTAGFLSGTTVAMVPILNGIIIRKFPKKRVVLAVFVALGGVAMMSLTSRLTLSVGAWLIIGGAFFYAVQIVIIDQAILHDCRSLVISVWQLGFTALFSGVGALMAGETTVNLDLAGWIGVLGLAFVCCSYGYIAQSLAQKSVSPERIGFIYSLEPVFCAIFAFLIFGEIMSLRELIGAVMIMISILM